MQVRPELRKHGRIIRLSIFNEYYIIFVIVSNWVRILCPVWIKQHSTGDERMTLLTKCSVCSAQIVFPDDTAIVSCMFCNSLNQRPVSTGETLARMERADELRRQRAYDEAARSYEHVLGEHPDEHTALWGRLMCKYGVEVVEEKRNNQLVLQRLLCHRARPTAIRNEDDFNHACELADPSVRDQYIRDAEYIDKVQANIRELARNREPWDVFICYKETSLHNPSEPTRDSSIARALCNRIQRDGYRVFFAPYSLIDMSGEMYEAEIYHAIHTARIMLLLGLKPEHFEATWPRSEWMRFMDVMELKGCTLIPIYGNGMTPEQLPKRIQNMGLQGFDIDGHPGYLEDLAHTVRFHLPIQSKPQPVQPQFQPNAPTPMSLLERAYLFIEDQDFDQARNYINRALDIDPKCAPAYAAMVCVKYSLCEEAELARIPYSYADDPNWKRALRFADAAQKRVYEGYIAMAKAHSSEAASVEKPTDSPAEALTPKPAPKAAPAPVPDTAPASKPVSTPTSKSVPEPEAASASVPVSMPASTGKHEQIAAKQNDSYKYIINADGTAEIKEYIGKSRGVRIPSDFDGHRLTAIGNGAFQGSRLTSIVIPDSVTSIGDLAFCDCRNLTRIVLPNRITAIASGVFDGCFGLTSIVIPDSVTSIGDDAFHDCARLTDVAIPDGMTSIGIRAFSECSSLVDITIPDSVTDIGDGAFHACTGLNRIVIPNHVTTIGNDTFYGCSGLTDVTIPKDVSSIGSGAFWDCSSLSCITIPDGVASIGEYAFCNCSRLTRITIPDRMISIEKGVFYDCAGLTSITLPNNLASIGDSAFWGCSSLTDITIPDSVTSIDAVAFWGCDKLTIRAGSDSYAAQFAREKNIPLAAKPSESASASKAASVSKAAAVVNASNAEKAAKSAPGRIRISAQEQNSDYIYTVYTNGTIRLNAYLRKQKHVDIPSEINGSRVTSIGAHAFRDIASLSSVTIRDGVTSIGNDAFSDCSKLTDIIIPDSVTSIGSSAFSGCSCLTSITIPNSVTTISPHAFSFCIRLTDIAISDSVTSIDAFAFSNCSSLTDIKIPNGVISIGRSAFMFCESLTGITIPDSVTSIDESAFGGCVNLAGISIPDSVTFIGKGAFEYCNKLTIRENSDSYAAQYAKENNIPLSPIAAASAHATAKTSGAASEEAEKLLKQGMLYYQDGADQNLKEAFACFEQAADRLPEAQYMLGKCYFFGRGVTQDYTKAVYWYQEAAERGNARAQVNLGNCYYNGEGISKDLSMAVHWYKKAAKTGFVQAQFNLGEVYCRLADTIKQLILSTFIEEFDSPDRRLDRVNADLDEHTKKIAVCISEAVYWFQKAAEQGSVKAQYRLGYCYEAFSSVVDVNQDPVKAVEWYRKAAGQGDVDAQYRLGLCLLGLGEWSRDSVPVNKTEALEWLNKAAEQGSQPAAEALKELRSQFDSQTVENHKKNKSNWFKRLLNK